MPDPDDFHVFQSTTDPMTDLDDFHAFQSTTDSSRVEPRGFQKIALWLFIILGLLWLIGKLS